MFEQTQRWWNKKKSISFVIYSFLFVVAFFGGSFFSLDETNASSLVPTIHSVSTSGNWNDPNSWIEGRVAKNYYQRNSNPLLFLRGSELSLAEGNNTTDLHNTEAKYLDDFYDITNHETSMWHTDFWHTNIDELLINYISTDIKNNF